MYALAMTSVVSGLRLCVKLHYVENNVQLCLEMILRWILRYLFIGKPFLVLGLINAQFRIPVTSTIFL